MKLMLVGPNRTSLDSLARTLTKPGIAVSACVDVGSAVSECDAQHPEAIFVDLRLPRADLKKLIAAARSATTGGPPWLVAMFDKVPSGALSELLELGIDDFIRTPATSEELLARARTPSRIRRRSGRSPSSLDWTRGLDPSAAESVRNLGQAGARDLEEVTGLPLVVTLGASPEEAFLAAEIPMTLVAENRNLQVMVTLSSGTVRSLSTILFGIPDADSTALEDMARELANTVGGAFKRAALDERLAVTTGLPIVVPAASIAGASQPPAIAWTLTSPDDPAIRIAIVARSEETSRRVVPAHQLTEGMVLATDVRNSASVLILAAGTRLTESHVDRIVALVGPQCLIDTTSKR